MSTSSNSAPQSPSCITSLGRDYINEKRVNKQSREEENSEQGSPSHATKKPRRCPSEQGESTFFTSPVAPASTSLAAQPTPLPRSLLREMESPSATCDVKDADKPHMASEIAQDIYEHHRDTEEYTAPGMYMHRQQEMDARSHASLVNWMVEIHLRLRLEPATLYLGVSLLDQYCESNQVELSELLLVGMTALFLASKYEETRGKPPDVDLCLYAMTNTHTREELLQMEMQMLNFFDFNVACPTCHHFLQRFLRIGGYEPTSRTAHRAAYYSQRCLQEHDMLLYAPSLVAAAATYLAASQTKDSESAWAPEQRQFSGYTLEEILPCARQISAHLNGTAIGPHTSLQAVQKKFENPRFGSVSKELPPLAL